MIQMTIFYEKSQKLSSDRMRKISGCDTIKLHQFDPDDDNTALQIRI